MKHILIILGLLSFVPAAHAAPQGVPPPISKYVSDVLERADRIQQNFVDGLAASPDCAADKENSIASALSSVRKAMDSTLLITTQATELRDVTVCQRYDLDIVEKKLRLLQDKMVEYSQNCKLASMETLATVHSLVAQLYKDVAFGGLDPQYTNFDLRRAILNDPEKPEAQVCPFHSDYAPPAIAQFSSGALSVGCDIKKLTFILEQDIPEPRKKEAQQDKAFQEKMRTISQDLGGQILAFENAFRTVLARLRGGELPPPVDTSQAEHGVVEGCKDLKIKKVVQINSSQSSEIPEVFKVETWDPSGLPPGMILRPTTDPFSPIRFPIVIIKNFIDLYVDRAVRRPIPLDDFYDMFEILENYDSDISDIEVSVNHAREQAALEVVSRDSQERMFAALSPLREAVLNFGYVGSFPAPGDTRPLLPGYVRDLALFLRRSCVWGYCNNTLDSVLKRALNEHCYPYGSGCYREDDYVEKCYDNTQTEC